MTTLSETHAMHVADPKTARDYSKAREAYPAAKAFIDASPIIAGRFVNAMETLEHFLAPHSKDNNRNIHADLRVLLATPVGTKILAMTLSRAEAFEKRLPELQAQIRTERNLVSRTGRAWALAF